MNETTEESQKAESLPELRLDEWEPSKDTLHLYAQIVGKVRLASTTRANHWWNVPLYVTARGLTTRRMRQGGVSFEIDFDFLDHELIVRTARGEREAFPLVDGLSIAAFHQDLFARLVKLGIRPAIRSVPYRVPMTTPFPEDEEHASYDAAMVERFWRVLLFADQVFTEFSGWYSGKQSPVHVFWHSFDLALTRFSGRPAPVSESADAVSREAYSHEVISFGFWAGDGTVRRPTFYSYTAPEPPGLTEERLRPPLARWASPYGSSNFAMLDYDDVRNAPDPRRLLLQFLQSAYEAGARRGGWDTDALASSTAPKPGLNEAVPASTDLATEVS
jgi:hypothetical protein